MFTVVGRTNRRYGFPDVDHFSLNVIDGLSLEVLQQRARNNIAWMINNDNCPNEVFSFINYLYQYGYFRTRDTLLRIYVYGT